MYELKYHHNIGLGERLAKELVKLIESLRWKCDMVIPLPLGSERLKERGYNQAMLLAGPIAWDLHLPLQRQAVKRVKETQSQVGLSRRQRIGNVRQAFDAEPLYVTGKQILLVDDVVTTGATINAYAKALKDAKAESVYGLTLARSIHLY
ncbi:MAG: phosphoribosyltransferase family protein [Anaerolineales bacterium]